MNNVDYPDQYGFTPLHIALNKYCITTLLKYGADISVCVSSERDNVGQTPLHVALICQSEDNLFLDAILSLLDGGVDLNAKDQRGRTPLDRSAGETRRLIEDWIRDNEVPIKEPASNKHF